MPTIGGKILHVTRRDEARLHWVGETVTKEVCETDARTNLLTALSARSSHRDQISGTAVVTGK
jgi:hypothetical protein